MPMPCHLTAPLVRSLRELEELDVTDNTDDYLTNGGRSSRSPAESRKHLRVGDAHQVANYFITGGPLKGHSHFVGSSNCEPNNDESNIVGISNPVSNSDTDLPADLPEDNENKNSANANSFDSLVGLPYIPALPQLVQPHLLRRPTPRIPVIGGILRSIVHPRFHHHFNRLHSIPGALVGAANAQLHGLLNAHHVFRKTLLPGIAQAEEGSLLGSTNPQTDESKINPGSDSVPSNEETAPVLGAYPTSYNSKFPATHLVHPDYFPHLQPTGYIVKFVPHNGDSYPPVVGSPQQPSDYTDSNTDTEQNLGSVNNENEDADVAEQDDPPEGNENVNTSLE
ncbi:uncharacterized protein LOC143219278 [Lasioglossum baleicum]|uniref:uncharacterized protein LOC143219278 n=1 Tax=Lasioglossum baleicum TaxID=434251 RepID=UPI003FCC8A92